MTKWVASNPEKTLLEGKRPISFSFRKQYCDYKHGRCPDRYPAMMLSLQYKRTIMFWDPCYGRATLSRLIHVVTDVIEDNDFQLSTEMEHLLTFKIDKRNSN